MIMTKRAIFKLIIIAFVLVAAFFLYRFFFVKDQSVEKIGVESVVAVTPESKIDNEFLGLLARLQRIELDAPSVFNHPVWQSLENFRRALVPEPRGRRNPFAITGADLITATTTATTTAPRRCR